MANHTQTAAAGMTSVLEFPLVQALLGRRARRFSLGASIPDGPLAFTSRQEQLPLSELEFYDHHVAPGAYLETHAQHMARWHVGEPE